MTAKILVTGATGNVGVEVVRALLAHGVQVRAGDIDPDRIKQLFGEQVEAAYFRFGESTTYPLALAGIEKMFLMRPPQISDVQRYMLPAIDAALAAGVEHFVFLSLIGIENNRQVPHYKVEQYLKALGVSYTFLRASFFMQNLNTIHRAEIRDRDEIFIPAGASRTSFIDVRDIGAVAALALSESGHTCQAYDLTGAEALNYYEVARLFSQEMGRPITYRNPSIPAYVIRQLRAGTKLPFALITAWLYSNTRRGMADTVTGEVERLLGRKPLSLAQYIHAYRESWSKVS